MKLGNKFFLILILYTYSYLSFAEDKITSTPLINVEEIKPSFEDLELENENTLSKEYFDM